MSPSPLVIPSTKGRDVLIVVCGVCIALAFGIYALLQMGAGVSGNTLTGTIVKKEFTPQQEEQVTIGQGGLHAQHIEGEYILDVNVGDHPFRVWVNKTVYDANKVGDMFTFLRPK